MSRPPRTPVRVRADAERLTQAVGHLLDNAVRFTPDGGHITVRVGREAGSATVSVHDTGIGIPANELEWIFDKVYEVGEALNHSSGRSQFGSRGLGMGLALAKAIVEGHGGKIGVRSVPGAGSEFTVTLPPTAVTPAAATHELVEVG
jgi:signal transduction histidine kinase